jgi:hypothetical protein
MACGTLFRTTIIIIIIINNTNNTVSEQCVRFTIPEFPTATPVDTYTRAFELFSTSPLAGTPAPGTRSTANDQPTRARSASTADRLLDTSLRELQVQRLARREERTAEARNL